ncbi:hypothetical protein [Rhizobium leguminosarum]|uniref:hypothetical protein n=1 Tax=Rhizobium leguminosarum TaxID=384 RepID=UPI001AEB56E4|nr:hypothetical protein [Rhizobium leguminosarum]MBP2443441.1 hypothetical protein [Rhizobium leguminosarum]
MMTIRELLEHDPEFRAAVNRIQYQLSISRAASSFANLLEEWDLANRLGDPDTLAAKIAEFLDQLLPSLLETLSQTPNIDHLKNGGCDLLRDLLQGHRSDAEIYIEGWDAADARAEIGGMFEMLNRFGFPESLGPDFSDPGVAWLQEHANGEEIEHMKPDEFICELDSFIANLADARLVFLKAGLRPTR